MKSFWKAGLASLAVLVGMTALAPAESEAGVWVRRGVVVRRPVVVARPPVVVARPPVVVAPVYRPIVPVVPYGVYRPGVTIGVGVGPGYYYGW
jgi:hypothetical protein